MITATGKLQLANFEFVGNNETPKLTVEVSANGAVVPVSFIGDKALAAYALLGDQGLGHGTTPPGALVHVYANQGYRYWEGDENNAPKTFTTELDGIELLVLGSVGSEGTSHKFQGVLYGYEETSGEGQNGPYTRRTVRLLVPAFKKGELLPAASVEFNVHNDAVVDVQKNLGQFVVVGGTVSSFQWTPKKGKNVGVPQRSVKYTLGSQGNSQVIAMTTPAWIAGHGSFQIPEGASGNIPMTPAPAPAPVAAAAGFDTPLF